MSSQVRFFALHQIKPHAPPLVAGPVNSFEFLASILPRRDANALATGTARVEPPSTQVSIVYGSQDC